MCVELCMVPGITHRAAQKWQALKKKLEVQQLMMALLMQKRFLSMEKCWGPKLATRIIPRSTRILPLQKSLSGKGADNLKSTLIISGVVVAVIGAIFAVAKKIKEA
ncbi:hypothetical protein Pfo_007385 [Paulownia fortunei]|nr:hypothetical protein Pfo_007385 [Paulownia fortunei]